MSTIFINALDFCDFLLKIKFSKQNIISDFLVNEERQRKPERKNTKEERYV